MHFSVLLGAGLGIARSLQVLREDPDKKMAEVIASVNRRVDSGHTLSSAMAAHPQVFAPMYVSLVRVAELTGGITRAFDRLAQNLERQSNLRQRLTSALVYPCFVLITTLGMTFFLLYFLLPMFLKTFAESGAKLPWLTQALVTVAGNRALIVIVPAVLAALAAGLWLYARRSERRERLQQWLYRIPVLGRFLYLMALAQMTESLALLLENGVDLMRSLDCLRQSPSGWIPLDRAVCELQERVFEGEELSEAMHSTRAFPTLLINLVAAGESVGTLHPWFARYSRLIEEELQETVDGLVAILEPLMLMFLGGGVGIVVLACFLPTYQLMTAL